MLVTFILDVGRIIALSIDLYSHAMHFLLSHAARKLSSHIFSTEIRASPSFEVHVWHNVFLFEIDGRFGN